MIDRTDPNLSRGGMFFVYKLFLRDKLLKIGKGSGDRVFHSAREVGADSFAYVMFTNNEKSALFYEAYLQTVYDLPISWWGVQQALRGVKRGPCSPQQKSKLRLSGRNWWNGLSVEEKAIHTRKSQERKTRAIKDIWS